MPFGVEQIPYLPTYREKRDTSGFDNLIKENQLRKQLQMKEEYDIRDDERGYKNRLAADAAHQQLAFEYDQKKQQADDEADRAILGMPLDVVRGKTDPQASMWRESAEVRPLQDSVRNVFRSQPEKQATKYLDNFVQPFKLKEQPKTSPTLGNLAAQAGAKAPSYKSFGEALFDPRLTKEDTAEALGPQGMMVVQKRPALKHAFDTKQDRPKTLEAASAYLASVEGTPHEAKAKALYKTLMANHIARQLDEQKAKIAAGLALSPQDKELRQRANILLTSNMRERGELDAQIEQETKRQEKRAAGATKALEAISAIEADVTALDKKHPNNKADKDGNLIYDSILDDDDVGNLVVDRNPWLDKNKVLVTKYDAELAQWQKQKDALELERKAQQDIVDKGEKPDETKVATLDKRRRELDIEIDDLRRQLAEPETKVRLPKKGQDTPSGPAIGTVSKGYRFKGGDPAKPESWQKVS